MDAMEIRISLFSFSSFFFGCGHSQSTASDVGGRLRGVNDKVVVSNQVSRMRGQLCHATRRVLGDCKPGRVAKRLVVIGGLAAVPSLMSFHSTLQSSELGSYSLGLGTVATGTVEPGLNNPEHLVRLVVRGLRVHRRRIGQVVPVLGAGSRQELLLELHDGLGARGDVAEHEELARGREEIGEGVRGAGVFRRGIEPADTRR